MIKSGRAGDFSGICSKEEPAGIGTGERLTAFPKGAREGTRNQQ